MLDTHVVQQTEDNVFIYVNNKLENGTNDDEIRNIKAFKFLVEIEVGKNGGGTHYWTTRVVTAQSIREGAMIEYYDAETFEYAGCVGINTFRDDIKSGKIGIIDDGSR